jgi:hypothetical protein
MEIAFVSWPFNIGYLLFSNLKVNHKENKTTFGVSFHVLKVMIYFKLFDLLKLINVQEAFRRLPLPYIDQEFSIEPNNKQDLETESEPPPYVHIKHSILC